MEIINNDSLQTLSGLDNINSYSIEHMKIDGNHSLSTCNTKSICEFLSHNYYHIIHNNADGCNTEGEIIDDCLKSCLSEGITFTSQTDIVEFQQNYPDCIEIEGDVIISGDDITDLSYLNNITIVHGDLRIYNNANLVSVEGLDNLVSIAGDLFIGDESKGGNPELLSLNYLSNLTSIGGGLVISNNNKLTSLDGLDKIEDGTISNLVISDNELLSTCDVTSVCNYLSDMTSIVEIRNNSTGCNSQTEVVTACTYGIFDQSFSSEFIINPNPATNEISVLSVNGLEIKEIKIYNQWGQLILTSSEVKEVIDISNFKPGLYIVEITSNQLKHRGKLVIHK